MADHIRYDLLTQQALRGVVRTVLTDAVKKGLPGEHHFYISFDTQAEGVRLSQRLKAQYPEEMTIILQHQFWDLTVDDDGFEVGLSFGGIPERLAVPFEAIKGFFDPSVQFGLQFEEIVEGESPAVAPPAADTKVIDPSEAVHRTHTPKQASAASAKATPAPANPEPETRPEPDAPGTGGAQVVRLDRFRKK